MQPVFESAVLISCSRPHERNEDDLEMVYDELMRIRALSHLGNSVRRELAHVIVFESHPKAGEVRKYTLPIHTPGSGLQAQIP